jgi:glutaredoxin
MAVKLHRCKNVWVKLPGHPCWKVQKALDEQGIDYEIVKEPWMGDRTKTVEHTGQKKFPWIEFEDGSIYREESKDMAETIRSGRLNEKRGAGSEAPVSP